MQNEEGGLKLRQSRVQFGFVGSEMLLGSPVISNSHSNMCTQRKGLARIIN